MASRQKTATSTRGVVVHASWDDEAQVWVATSADVPGLVAEAGDVEGLLKKLRVLVPELLEANGVVSRRELKQIQIPLELITAYREQITLRE